MTYILVTNDDGYDQPGLTALSSALQSLGTIKASAPTVNQSASGHKKTLFTDIVVEHTQLANGIPAISVGGSPSDCVAVAAHGLIDWPPRIVVSGINRGENMAQDLTYSGTVTAALEGVIHGVPGIAVSLSSHTADTVEEYEVAAQVAVKVTQHVLEKGLPPFTILNVNVPFVTSYDDLRGIRLTRQGVRIYLDELEQDGNKVKIVGDIPSAKVDEEGTDVWAVHRGFVSITPVHLDMTAHRFLADLNAWDIQL